MHWGHYPHPWEISKCKTQNPDKPIIQLDLFTPQNLSNRLVVINYNQISKKCFMMQKWLKDCLNLRRGFVSNFLVLGRVLRHFCNVLLLSNKNLKQNIAEMSQDASQDKKQDTKSVFKVSKNTKRVSSKKALAGFEKLFFIFGSYKSLKRLGGYTKSDQFLYHPFQCTGSVDYAVIFFIFLSYGKIAIVQNLGLAQTSPLLAVYVFRSNFSFNLTQEDGMASFETASSKNAVRCQH